MVQSSYRKLLETSKRINWRVEDLIGGDKRLDFTRPFLPETYARTASLDFLSAQERLALNHIRAHGYLALFELVEGFILPFISAQSTAQDHGDPFHGPAYRNFAEEEAKHMLLFQRFRRDFTEQFGTACGVIGPPEAITRTILEHGPLAVAILVLGIEWMSQGHYVDSVKDDSGLDAQFKSLLRHHWMEEAQHAKLDALLVQSMAKRCTAQEIDHAIDEYLAMAAFFDAGLEQQAALDLESLQAHIGRTLARAEREHFLSVQRHALRWTILGSAMRNENFLAVLGTLGPEARARVEAAARDRCWPGGDAPPALHVGESAAAAGG